MNPVFVHERVFIDADDQEHVERVVGCPRDGVIPFSRCEQCPHFFEVTRAALHGGDAVDCAMAPLLPASALTTTAERADPERDDETTVGDIMTYGYVAVDRGASVEVARRRFIAEQIGCVLVVDPSRLPIGVMTLRDLVQQAGEQRTVGEIASSPVLKVPPRMPVSRAAGIMAFEGIHHLAVVDVTGATLGVLSSLDVLRWLGQRGGMLIPRPTARQRASDFASNPRNAR